ncbi:MAG: NUDIX hydrolase [Rubrivivax sp.]|nr:NUDIX hydrolase [Rubrivivax sp.]
MNHRISAGAFVEHEGRLLLVRHTKPEIYDFWVAPGGGVKGSESLAEAAVREVQEETGLEVVAEKLVYVEEFFNPETRHCKFWFVGRLVAGELNTSHPEAKAEFITEAGWCTEAEVRQMQVFPTVVHGRYWQDRAQGFPGFIHLGIREMQVW